jgi:DNA-binding PadR family transcriptional regulator
MPERITRQLLAVLEAISADPSREWYGLELMEATGLSSGTLYPILHRLVSDGWLVRTREAPSEAGGSSRRLYKVTAIGARDGIETLTARGASARRPATGRRRRGLLPA